MMNNRVIYTYINMYLNNMKNNSNAVDNYFLCGNQRNGNLHNINEVAKMHLLSVRGSCRNLRPPNPFKPPDLPNIPTSLFYKIF
jgi:hypothetical protein